MIGVEIGGGLGNQMFQYAFIVSNSAKLKRRFFLLKQGAPIELYRYFKLKKNIFYYFDIIFFNHDGYRLAFSHYLRTAFYFFVTKYSIQRKIRVDNTDDPKSALESVFDKTLYKGYFQSAAYFNNARDEVITAFELKKRIQIEYRRKYPFPPCRKRVALHIRKTDYRDLAHLNLGGADLSLPFSYYHQVINKIHHENNYYIFISDEPGLIADEFDYLTEKLVSTDTAIVDFQHMLTADICVVANSTFSWWAAYLNKNPAKLIYCPKHFLGFKISEEYPVNIYPDEWTPVSVL